MTTSQYVPGVCNIGEAEIAQRRRAGWIGLIVTFVAWAVLYFFHVPAAWRLLLVFPASFAATGFLQGLMHFCAGFGMRGVFNFGNELRKTESVSQAEFRAKDKRKAQTIFAYSVAIGILVAVIAFLL